MYINRKKGELVEAEFDPNAGLWTVSVGKKDICMQDDVFQEQYGEAMICPVDKRDCGLLCKGEHCGIHSKLIDCGITCEDKKYPCIPYIPEEYDVDNEPTFPICGTCNARKSNLSWLMLTPEQLNKVVWRYTDKEKQTYALGTIIKEIAKAQINHLAKPEFGIFKLIDGEFIRFEHYLKENEK